MPKKWQCNVRLVESKRQLKIIVSKMPRSDLETMGYDTASDYYIHVGIANKNAENWDQELIEANQKMHRGWLPEYANVKGNFKPNEFVESFRLHIAAAILNAKAFFDIRKPLTQDVFNGLRHAAHHAIDYGYSVVLMFGTEKRPCKLV